MMRNFTISSFLLLLPVMVFSIAPSLAQLQPSVSGTYLVTPEGTPVFLNGTAPWDINNLTNADVHRFIDSCYSHKINYWQVRMMSPANFGGPANGYGQNPWAVTQTFSSTPNDAFWDTLRAYVRYAWEKKIYVMLYPDYLGGDPSQGWSTQTNDCSLTNMYTFGQYLGGRFKDEPNVLWALGGDCNPASPYSGYGDARPKLDTLMDGIRSAGDTHMVSTRDEPGTTIDDHWNTSTYPYINYNYAYSYTTDWWSLAQSVRGRKPILFCDLRETYYENEAPLSHNTTQLELRRAAYQFALWAFPAIVYGNCPVWSFDGYYGYSCSGTWTDNLNTQGMLNAKWIGNLMMNRRFYLLIPDTNNAILTSGYGASGTRAVCAYSSRTIIVYTPASATLTVTSAGLTENSNDSTHAWWYDVETGTPTWIGNFSNASHDYASGKERVLVLDAKSAGYGAPGLDTTVVTEGSNFVERIVAR